VQQWHRTTITVLATLTLQRYKSPDAADRPKLHLLPSTSICCVFDALPLCCRPTAFLASLSFVRHGCIAAKRCKIGPMLLLLINSKSHTPFQMRFKSSPLDDFEGQYCNRNCIGCSAFFLATAGFFVL